MFSDLWKLYVGKFFSADAPPVFRNKKISRDWGRNQNFTQQHSSATDAFCRYLFANFSMNCLEIPNRVEPTTATIE